MSLAMCGIWLLAAFYNEPLYLSSKAYVNDSGVTNYTDLK